MTHKIYVGDLSLNLAKSLHIQLASLVRSSISKEPEDLSMCDANTGVDTCGFEMLVK